jgi:hypothetical protein
MDSVMDWFINFLVQILLVEDKEIEPYHFWIVINEKVQQ